MESYAGGDFPWEIRLYFFTNSVMSVVDKSFIISTGHMSPSLLSQNNLFVNDSDASDHLPVIVDFILPINTTGFMMTNQIKKQLYYRFIWKRC